MGGQRTEVRILPFPYEIGSQRKKIKVKEETEEAMTPKWTAASWERDNILHNI
jgi:hypothetical protein